MADFYRAEKVNDRITAIISFTGESMYLVNGSERSLLIDTCVGAGNLRDFVERLTEKPLTCCLPMATSIMQWEHRNSPGMMESLNVRST